MNTKRYSEKELIYPALFFIKEHDGNINTSSLIEMLSASLDISEEDNEILFGRNDTRFSQKVRNLISHNSLTPYIEYTDAQPRNFKINALGEEYLANEDNCIVDFSVLDNTETQLEAVNDFPNLRDFLYDRDVRVSLVNQTAFELYRRAQMLTDDRRGGLILDDSFQRNSVWNKTQKSQLIESILIGIPLPLFYLAEDKRANLIVVDGRQRLTSIFEFLDGKYKLTNLQMLKELNGKGVDDFVGEFESLRAKIEDSFLYVARIDKNIPEVIKLQLFSRVNRNGTPLNAQEVRHALHQGSVTELLASLSISINIAVASNRMKDRQMILRALALQLYYSNELINYETRRNVEYTVVDDYLGEAMDAINTFSQEQLQKIEAELVGSCKRALNIFGDNSFRLSQGSPINMILFEVTLLIVWLNKGKNDIHIERFLNDYKTFQPDGYSDDSVSTWFEDNIRFHRDSKENFNKRISVINILKEKYND